MKGLNLGCGEKRMDGFVNVDVTDRTKPDLVHDLNVLPWPFESDTFDHVKAFDVVEHLDDLVAFMEEVSSLSRWGHH